MKKKLSNDQADSHGKQRPPDNTETAQTINDTKTETLSRVESSDLLGNSFYWSGNPPQQYLGSNTPPCSGNY